MPTEEGSQNQPSNELTSSSASVAEWINLAAKYVNEEWWYEAAEAYQRALVLKPDDAMLWARYGDALLNMRRSLEAARAFARSLMLRSSMVELPASLQEAGAPQPSDEADKDERTAALRALTALELGLRLFPEDALYWEWRGTALTQLERFDEALLAFDHALALGAYAGVVSDAKGRIQLELGRFVGVLEAFERAVTSGSPEAWDGHGQALMALERYDEAAASFERAIALAPQYGLAWKHLGQVRRAQGYFEAAEDLERHNWGLPEDDTSIPF